jgi:hypothetical protein
LSNIKVNSQTGQIAIARGTSPRADAVTIYEPGDYKVNELTGQVAVQTPNGLEVHDLTPDQAKAFFSPEAIYRRQAGGVGQISEGTPTTGMGESALRGAQQGVLMGLGDEIGAETSAALGAINGDVNPLDPNHPVTGGMGQGFGPAYQNDIKSQREEYKAAKASNPKAYGASQFAGSMLSAGMMPAARTIGQAGMQGLGYGGLLSFGNADTQDPKAALKQTVGGGVAGGLLGMGVNAIMRPALADTTASGLAYRALDESTPGGIGNIQVRPSAAPAEINPGMSDMLRSAGAMNGPAAANAIPAAQQRMQNVNQAIIDQVNRQLSPEDAALYLQRLQQQAQTQNQAAYATAYADPTRVGLTPATTARPSFQDALGPAQAAAADELPARAIDPTNLGVKDIDLIDRILQSTQRAAAESHGDTSQAAQIAKALIPTRGQVADDVRTVADQAFPALANARQQAAQSFAQERAIETGRTWLRSGTSAEEVAAQFANMSQPEREGALAAFATDIKNTLGTKVANANLGTFFSKNAVAEKLQAVGVPDQIVARIVQGGQGARDVLNALQGGSMTARNTAFKEGLQSTLSSVRSGDLAAGALLNSPAVTLGLPLARAAGTRAGTNAAGMLVDALTTPGAAGLASIYNRAPQTWGGYLAMPPMVMGAQGGALLGQQYGGQ